MGQLPGRARPNAATVPTAADAQRRLQRAARRRTTCSSHAPQIIRDPTTGQPFPGNIIPANRLSPNGLAMLRALSRCRRRASARAYSNAIINSENPQDQRKDNIRFDYRLNAQQPFTYRYGKYNWVGDRRLPRHVPVRADRLGSAEHDPDGELDEHAHEHTGQRGAATPTALDEVFINVLESEPTSAARTASTIRTCSRRTRRSPTRSRPSRSPASDRNRRRAVSGVLARSDPHVLEHDDVGQEPAHVQGRHRRSSTRARTTSTRSTCSRFPAAPTTRTAGSSSPTAASARTGVAIADAALGLFHNYAEIGQRALTKWRALATDIFVQDSWRPRSNLTIEGGVRYVLWPPWSSLTNNIATFDPAFYSTTNQAVHRSVDRRDHQRPALQRHRPAGRRLPDRRRATWRSTTIRRSTRCSSARRAGLTKTHKNVFEPRGGVSYA